MDGKKQMEQGVGNEERRNRGNRMNLKDRRRSQKGDGAKTNSS